MPTIRMLLAISDIGVMVDWFGKVVRDGKLISKAYTSDQLFTKLPTFKPESLVLDPSL